MKHKKTIIMVLLVVAFIGVILAGFAITSISSENCIITFDDKNNKSYEIKSNGKRSKRVYFELSVKDDEQKTGSVIIEVKNNDGTVKFKQAVLPGKNIKQTFSFSRGGNENIIISPKDFKGQISYKKRAISFY